jgi:hypothetical protein
MFFDCSTWGINSCYGVYLSYYLSHQPPLFSATSVDYAWVGGVCICILEHVFLVSRTILTLHLLQLTLAAAMGCSPIANFLTRRYSSNVTLLIGCVLQAASLIGASFAYKIWHLFLAQGVLFGVGKLHKIWIVILCPVVLI